MYPVPKCALNSWAKGEIEIHPASPASTTCSIVKAVVASVFTPWAVRRRHACMPSHVAGTFVMRRFRSKPGCSVRASRWNPGEIEKDVRSADVLVSFFSFSFSAVLLVGDKGKRGGQYIGKGSGWRTMACINNFADIPGVQWVAHDVNGSFYKWDHAKGEAHHLLSQGYQSDGWNNKKDGNIPPQFPQQAPQP